MSKILEKGELVNMNVLMQMMGQINQTDQWSINNLLNNVSGSLSTWGRVLVVIVGLVMVIVSVFKIAQGLMSGGRGQVNWVLNIILFFVGGMLAFGGGWSTLQSLSQGGEKTLDQLGHTITAMAPYIQAFLS